MNTHPPNKGIIGPALPGAAQSGEVEQQSSVTATSNSEHPDELHGLEALRSQIAHWLHIPAEDQDGIDFILAVYVSNRFPGDPLWGLLVDASGGGKTELLRPLRRRPDAYFVSKLTEKSLKSGYRDPKNPDKDPSLLPQLDGKVLIIKDLSPILSMRRESRNAIISDLRDAYDGFTDDGFGNVGKVSYESRFSLLAASTLAIERFNTVDQELGERFVKFRARGKDNRSKVRRAVDNAGKDDGWRKQIDAAIEQFLSTLPSGISQEIPTGLRGALAVVSDFIATARSHVPRDRNHTLAYVPRPEVGTRLGKELSKLLLALAYIRGKKQPDEQDVLTVLRVAEDCLPPNRLETLAAIISSRKPALPDKTARDTIADLKILGILDAEGRLEQSWSESLQEIGKLLSTPPLQKCATSGVSEVFIGFIGSDLSTPPDTAHLSEAPESEPKPSPGDSDSAGGVIGRGATEGRMP